MVRPFVDVAERRVHAQLAHAPLRQESVRDPLLVDGCYRGNHIGTNDARFDFEDGNIVRRKAGGEELNSHG